MRKVSPGVAWRQATLPAGGTMMLHTIVVPTDEEVEERQIKLTMTLVRFVKFIMEEIFPGGLNLPRPFDEPTQHCDPVPSGLLVKTWRRLGHADLFDPELGINPPGRAAAWVPRGIWWPSNG